MKIDIALVFPLYCRYAGGIIMAIGLEDFKKFISDNRGKRKFKQTVELAINFKGVNFAKQENRINMEVTLPNGRGKSRKIAIFTSDKNLSEEAAKNNIMVISGGEIETIGKDQARLSSLLEYDLMAQPNLMPAIAKNMGQFLGPRGKMPKPLLPTMKIANVAGELDRKVELRCKGKFLPTLHATVGSEDMDPEKLYENINEVLNSVGKKVGQNSISSAYVKLTMSSPIKFA